MISVTGPSFTRSTSIMAPNDPVATGIAPWRSSSTKRWYNCSASSGSAALTKEGRRPLRTSAYSVNCVGQKHGLPDRETLERLQNTGSEILCTQLNCSAKHKSACYKVRAAKCPARGKPRTVSFALNTATGRCRITPTRRGCRCKW